MAEVKILISYAHKDEDLKNELFEFLSPLRKSGTISIWSDRAIEVGKLWDMEIKNALEKAEIILFLLSPAFLASDYINEIEILGAMERHKNHQVKLIPIMLRPCDIEDHVIPNEKYKISDFQGLPKDMKPVVSWPLRDDAWMNVIAGLRPVIQTIAKQRPHG